jgi:hypothetical protein
MTDRVVLQRLAKDDLRTAHLWAAKKKRTGFCSAMA